MARNSKIQLKKEMDITRDFNRVSSLPAFKSRPDKVSKFLRNKYYLTDSTIDAILRGDYEKNRQKKQQKFVDPAQLSILDFTT